MHALGVLCLLTGHWGVSACHTLACVIGIPLVTKSLIIIVRMLGCCKYSVRFRNGKAAGRKNCGNGAKKCGKRARRGCVRSRTGAQRCGKRLHGICSKGDTVRPHSCPHRGADVRKIRLYGACSKGDTVQLRPYSHRGEKRAKNGCTRLAARAIQCGCVRIRTGAKRRGNTAVRGLQQRRYSAVAFVPDRGAEVRETAARGLQQGRMNFRVQFFHTFLV